jgi:hypothetical protein
MMAQPIPDTTIKPSRWRKQHGRVIVAAEQIVDAQGNIGAPYRGLSLLDEWERSGRITSEMHQAGDEFHRLFRLACLDPLQAADMGRVGGCGARDKHRGSLHARDEVRYALEALGGFSSPLGSSAWFILGCEFSLRKWAERGIWGGRAINKDVAAGILIGALSGLQKHFGY